jgi:hypothetical protein
MDLDLTGLWTWTAPLWGLAALVFFLAAIMLTPADILTVTPTPVGVLERLAPATMIGGARRKRNN